MRLIAYNGMQVGIPVDDSIHEDLDGVAVGKQVHDVKGVPDDAHLQHDCPNQGLCIFTPI